MVAKPAEVTWAVCHSNKEKTDMTDPIILWEYSNRIEADMAKALLEANGIESIVSSDDCGGMAGGQTFVRGVKIIVSRTEIEEAKKILNL
jgi:hypothetical protein